jgi:hypothetical protein
VLYDITPVASPYGAYSFVNLNSLALTLTFQPAVILNYADSGWFVVCTVIMDMVLHKIFAHMATIISCSKKSSLYLRRVYVCR